MFAEETLSHTWDRSKVLSYFTSQIIEWVCKMSHSQQHLVWLISTHSHKIRPYIKDLHFLQTPTPTTSSSSCFFYLLTSKVNNITKMQLNTNPAAFVALHSLANSPTSPTRPYPHPHPHPHASLPSLLQPQGQWRRLPPGPSRSRGPGIPAQYFPIYQTLEKDDDSYSRYVWCCILSYERFPPRGREYH